MKVLIVEDDRYKSEAIRLHLKSEFNITDVVIKDSLSSGVFEIMNCSDLDIIILDMSMPSFDISKKDPRGGNPESFAGEDFLTHMELLDLNVPVIVVTQFDTFGPDEDQIPLDKLNKKLLDNYGQFFVDCVYFKSTSNDWKKKLTKLIREIVK